MITLPFASYILQLSHRIPLSFIKVKVWFQNRRTKYKRTKPEDEDSREPCESSDPPPRPSQTGNTPLPPKTPSERRDSHTSSSNQTINHHSPHPDDRLQKLAFREDALDAQNSDSSQESNLSGYRSVDRSRQGPEHQADPQAPTSRKSTPGRPSRGEADGLLPKRSKTSHHVNRWRAETNQIWWRRRHRKLTSLSAQWCHNGRWY